MARLLTALALVCLFSLPAGAGELVDDSGRRITWERPFARIISLYAAHSENLFSLGLDEAIIGVSTSEDHPPAALRKPAFSYRDDPERFLVARPDLVLIRPMIWRGHRALVERLEAAGITVVSLQPTSFEEMYAYWEALGSLTGREAAAAAMKARFQAGLAAIKAKVAHIPPERRPGVYFESIHRKMKTFAPTAMAVSCLEAAGGVNLAGDARAVRGTNIAAYGKERILALGPRIDLYLAQVGHMNRVSREDIEAESGYKAIKAVREGRVSLVDERLVSRPTLRLLEGMARLQGLLYPDLERKP